MTGIRYTGTHFGTFEAATAAEGSIRLRPASFDPQPTPIMKSFEETLTSPLRIGRPAVRLGYLKHGAAAKGTRGDDPFVEVDWDQALDLAAEALRATYEGPGPQAVFGGSYGWASAGRFHHAQSQIHRFLNCLGGYTPSINTYSHAAAEVLLPHVVGSEDDIIYSGTTWPVIRDHTRLILAFGGLPSVTGQVSPGGVSAHTNADWIAACARAGVRMITIGPTLSHHDETLRSDWIAPRPNTDTAMMLGIAYHLVETGRHDREFLDRYTVGFDRFLRYLLGKDDGQPKTPDWAATICGVSAETIRDLAIRITDQRSLLAATWALQRADHGEQPFWMLVVLAAMVGQIGLPGGGFAFGLSSFNGVANPVHRRRYGALPQGRNPVRDSIPVARLTEMLENPGGEIEYDGRRLTFPDIRLIYWAGGNPFHHHQDLARLRAAWRKPETVIVNELEWNALARHADIVFPVAGVMERNDVMAANSDRRLVMLSKLAAPVGEARTDYEIMSGLAQRLGVHSAFTEGRDEEAWLRHLHLLGAQRFAAAGVTLPDFDSFRAMGMFEHCPETVERIGLGAFRADPQANPLATPSGRIEIFSERIAGFGYDDCPGHPVWLPPRSWLGAERAKAYPLHLMSPQPKARLHGQLDGNGASAAAKIGGREPCYLNAAEARKRGIGDGDLVRIHNDTGAALSAARVVDWVADGVLVLPTGAWYTPHPEDPTLCLHGNPNVLTRDAGTSRLSQGPSPNSTLVEVVRVTGDMAAPYSHRPPQLLQQAPRTR